MVFFEKSGMIIAMLLIVHYNENVAYLQRKVKVTIMKIIPIGDHGSSWKIL